MLSPVLLLGALFVVLLVIGVPIAFTLSITSLGYFLLLFPGELPASLFPQTMYSSTSSFTLTAIPFFIFMGELMNASGIADRLIAFAKSLVGHLRGGIAVVALLSSLMVAAFSGSSVANAAGTGTVTIPAMIKAGYSREVSASIESASSSLGTIVPPSVAMIVYGSLTGVSIKSLFLAGYLPAVAYSAGFIVLIWFLARRYNVASSEKSTAKQRFKSFIAAIGALLIPVIVMGGILTGLMTATEAGAIAAGYTLLIALFGYRSLRFRDIPAVCIATVKTTGVVMLVVATAAVLGWVLSYEKVPGKAAEALLGALGPQWAILIAVIFLMVALGTFMETLSALAITAPIVVGIGVGAGIDPLLLGVVVVMSLSIGMITPPVGVVLFVTTKLANTTIEKTSVAIIPFVGVLVLGTILLALVPGATLWLPRLFE